MAHGGDRYRNKIKLDFSVNINPLGTPGTVRRALQKSLLQTEYYPDPQAGRLREKLAEKLEVPEDYLLFGNGASELLMAAVHALQPKEVVLAVPSFQGYAWALGACGAKKNYYEMKPENGFLPGEDLLQALSEDTDLLLLTNPNNPTGRYIPKELLTEILERARGMGIRVLLDECFMELSDAPEENSRLRELETFPNLMLLRAFTKSFAVPALRLGYLLTADTKRKEQLQRHLPEWNLSIPAQAAGLAALEEKGYLNRAREEIRRQREYLRRELETLGFFCIPSEANFLLFRDTRDRRLDLYAALLEKKILIRDCEDYKGMPKGYYRIAVRGRTENEILLKGIREICGSVSKQEKRQRETDIEGNEHGNRICKTGRN